MIALLLIACVHQPPAPLFPSNVPPLSQPPERVPFSELDDACQVAAPFIPGKPAPFTIDGLVTCRAQVVPEAQVVEFVQDSDDAEHWRQVATVCHAYRLTDRQWAEQAMAHQVAELDVAVAEGNVAEAVGAALFVVGVVIGAGIGLAADAVAP